MVSTDDENTAHPNWPTGPFGDASELIQTGIKTEKLSKKHHKQRKAWPNPADDEPDAISLIEGDAHMRCERGPALLE